MASNEHHSDNNSCCGDAPSSLIMPGRDNVWFTNATSVRQASKDVVNELRAELCPIPSGIFQMGSRKSRYPADLDSPRRKVKVDGFLLSPIAVTNVQFARFVHDTGYRSIAETEGWSFVFHLLLKNHSLYYASPPELPWWRRVDGAYWAMPEGPGSSVAGREDHPVVHITWYDAFAYCTWAGLRLPTESEWERAARGGLQNQKFPWGNNLMPGGNYKMQTFQGQFPNINAADDSYIGTVPVGSYEPNGYGLYNMSGNVWEWVADRFGPLPQAGILPALNPQGAAEGYARVQRGGSYLCHESYCDRYYVHSRGRNNPDSSTGNAGFRVAADL